MLPKLENPRVNEILVLMVERDTLPRSQLGNYDRGTLDYCMGRNDLNSNEVYAMGYREAGQDYRYREVRELALVFRRQVPSGKNDVESCKDPRVNILIEELKKFVSDCEIRV